jgi:hypothetical protein
LFLTKEHVLALISSITRNLMFKICCPWAGSETPGNRLPLLHFVQAFLPMHFSR